MNLDDFIAKYNGKSIDYDSAYGTQCTDICKLWESENGWPIIRGNALDQPNNIDKNFYEYISINKEKPKAGNLVIWGAGIGKYGHIAIFIGDGGSYFKSFDQNFPLGSPAHIQQHNWNNVIGFITPRGAKMKEFIKFPTSDKVYGWVESGTDVDWSKLKTPYSNEWIKFADNEKVYQWVNDGAFVDWSKLKEIESPIVLGKTIADLKEQLKKAQEISSPPCDNQDLKDQIEKLEGALSQGLDRYSFAELLRALGRKIIQFIIDGDKKRKEN